MHNYRLGRYQGRPCILADLLSDKTKPEAFDYPRRSAEVFYSDRRPEGNYIDAVALLKTTPERNLGLVIYAAEGRIKERYSMADSNPSQQSLNEADIPALQEFMQRQRITDMARGIREFLQAKADGTHKTNPEELTQADLPQLEKFMKHHKIDPRTGFNEGLARYKRAKADGTLIRY